MRLNLPILGFVPTSPSSSQAERRGASLCLSIRPQIQCIYHSATNALSGRTVLTSRCPEHTIAPQT
ncbi:hypothetical protein BDW71DRAFT_51773 [Aspergillus fruticulosus]